VAPSGDENPVRGDNAVVAVASEPGDLAAERTGEREGRVGCRRLLSPDACNIRLPGVCGDPPWLTCHPALRVSGVGVDDASDRLVVDGSPVSSAPEAVLGRSSSAVDSDDRTDREPGLDSPPAVRGGGVSVSWQSSMTESLRD